MPASAIHVLGGQVANTEEELLKIARECRQQDAHRVIIVTSKAHTRRVQFVWHRLVGNDPELVVRHASANRFDAQHRWRTS
jgi:uncharacterized SAM-binding protein YcdF (DUF218 family)